SPGLPRRLAAGPQLLQHHLLPQRVHRLPETGMSISFELTLLGQGLEGRPFPRRGIAVDGVDDLGREDKIPAVDPAAITLRLFDEAANGSAVHVEGAIAPRRLYRRYSRQLAV